MANVFGVRYLPHVWGTGIGLALVRQLAGAMGAEVDAVNMDPGAAFSLRLPAARKA